MLFCHIAEHLLSYSVSYRPPSPGRVRLPEIVLSPDVGVPAWNVRYQRRTMELTQVDPLIVCPSHIQSYVSGSCCDPPHISFSRLLLCQLMLALVRWDNGKVYNFVADLQGMTGIDRDSQSGVSLKKKNV